MRKGTHHGRYTGARHRRLLALLLAALLTGCASLGPDFHPLDAPSLEKWNQALYQLAEPGDPDKSDLHAWWSRFHDPALEKLMRAADRHNPGLRQAGLRVLQARALLGVANAGRYPQSKLGSGALLFSHKRDKGGLLDSSHGFTAYQLDFTAGWELDFWGRFRRAIESADATFFASIQAQRALQVLLHAQVARLYFQWRILGRRLEIARHNLALRKRSFEIARELFHSGNTSELDLQQARTQYLTTLASIPRIEQQRQQTLNALAHTLGRAPGDLPELKTAASRPLPQVDGTRIRGIPARLLLRRPDVQAAAWTVAAQSARIGVAKADLYPALSLVGSLNFSGANLVATPDSTLLAAGPAVRWHLFDQGIFRNRVRLEDARLQEALEGYRKTVLAAALEVDNAAVGLVKSLEQTRILEQTVSAARRALQIAITSYREGYSDFQRVLTAQRALARAHDLLISVRGANLGYLIALYKGLGGGWKPATLDDLAPADVRARMKARGNWGKLLEQPPPRQIPSAVKESPDE